MNNLKNLKKKYAELGKEISELEESSEKWWHKVFAAKWSEGGGSIAAYSIFYVRKDQLDQLSDYTILATYQNKKSLISSITLSHHHSSD